MKSNFWTSQNLILIAMGLIAIPVGIAAGLYLTKMSEGSAAVLPPSKEVTRMEITRKPSLKESLEQVVVKQTSGLQPTAVEPALIEMAKVEETVVESLSTGEIEPEEHDHNSNHAEDEGFAIVKIKPEAPATSGSNQFREEFEVRRLIGRINQAPEESELHEHLDEIRNAIQNAEVVERIHNVTFNSANPHLDHRDETYLVSAMQNSSAMRKFRTHPDAKILVLGYASKDGDSRNMLYALNRAQSAEHTIHEHEEIFGFKGETRSWCIGETDSLSLETDEHCSQHNRAAEIWLVVSKDEVFEEIQSDNFLKTRIRESSHGHGRH